MGTTAIAIAAGVSAAVAIGSTAYQMSQGSPGGSGMLPETAQGRKAADMALDQYNTYLKEFKPTEEKFVADVMKPTTTEEAKQMGKVNADIAQQSAVSGDPNRLLRSPETFSAVAGHTGKSQNKVEQAVQAKQILAEQAVVDTGLHKVNTAQLGMDRLAADAQKNTIAKQQREVDETGQTLNAIGSAAGAVGAIAKNWPTSQPWNDYSGTIDNYDPYTTYVPDAPGPGPYAIQPVGDWT